jgi:hypothetical protein
VAASFLAGGALGTLIGAVDDAFQLRARWQLTLAQGDDALDADSHEDRLPG